MVDLYIDRLSCVVNVDRFPMAKFHDAGRRSAVLLSTKMFDTMSSGNRQRRSGESRVTSSLLSSIVVSSHKEWHKGSHGISHLPPLHCLALRPLRSTSSPYRLFPFLGSMAWSLQIWFLVGSITSSFLLFGLHRANPLSTDMKLPL